MISDFLAAMNQQQAVDSIRQTLGERVDTHMFIWLAVATAVVVGTLVYFSWRSRKSARELNNPTKLIKEVSQAIGLKPAEMKKLRMLVEKLDQPAKSATRNPMVLLLCPSLLAKTMKKK
jgi:hypothetical protein